MIYQLEGKDLCIMKMMNNGRLHRVSIRPTVVCEVVNKPKSS